MDKLPGILLVITMLFLIYCSYLSRDYFKFENNITRHKVVVQKLDIISNELNIINEQLKLISEKLK